MDELIQLLQSFNLDADNPDYTTLSDAQLGELQTALFDLFDRTRDGDVVDIELLEAIALGGEAIRVEDVARQEQAVADAARVADLDRQLRGETTEDPPADPDPTAQDPEDPEAADPADPPSDPEVDPAAADPAEDPVAVAAAAQPRRVPLSTLAQHRRAANTPTPADAPDSAPRAVITAGGDIPSVSAGQPLDDLDAVAAALVARVRSVDGTRLSAGQKFQVARVSSDYPEERQLDRHNTEQNMARIAAVVASAREAFLDGETGSMDALAAAGGRCAPLTARYEQEVVGDDARPIAAALPSFQGRRGGVRLIPPPVLSDIDTAGADAAVSQWTNTDDTNALNGEPTKAIQRITCDDEITVEDYAVVKRLLVGSNLARTNPERVRAFIDLTNVAWARYAEGLLLSRLKTLSVQMQEDLQVLGSRRDLLAVWIKAIWGLRNRHRDLTMPLQLIVPDAVIAHGQIDGRRQIPGDQRDRITAEELLGEMRALGVDPIITPDMPAAMAGPQAAGAQLVDLPSPIEWALFPMGTFAYIDGGDFDLGFTAGTPVRDTSTLEVNDYQLFAENWENVAKFGGPESLWGRTLVCPTGEVAGTVDVTCDTAS